MNAYGQGQYRQTQVTTVDKGKLIILLYEGAIKFLREAQSAQEAGDIPARANFINRALDIIGELTQSLNMNEGGQIAQNLYRIYQFWNDHLIKAKVVKDSGGIMDVIKMMSSLIEAWQSVCQNAEAIKVMPKDPMLNANSTTGKTI